MRGQSIFVLFFYTWTGVFAADAKIIGTYKDINVGKYEKEWSDQKALSDAERAQANALQFTYQNKKSTRIGLENLKKQMLQQIADDELSIRRLNQEIDGLRNQISAWSDTITAQEKTIAGLNLTLNRLAGEITQKKAQVDRQATIAKKARDLQMDVSLGVDDAELKLEDIANDLDREEAKRANLAKALGDALDQLATKLAALETLKEQRKQNTLTLQNHRTQEGNLRAAIKNDEDASVAIAQAQQGLQTQIANLNKTAGEQSAVVGNRQRVVMSLVQVIDQTHEDIEALSNRAQTLKHEMEETGREIRELIEDQRRNQTAKQQIDKKVEESQTKVGTLSGQKSSAETQVKPLLKEKADLDKEITDRKTQIDALSNQISAKEKEITAVEKTLAEAETRLTSAQKELDAAQAGQQALEKKSQDLTTEVQRLQKQSASKSTEVEPKRQRVAVVQDELKALKDTEAALRKQIQDASAEIQRLSTVLKPGTERLENLKKVLESLLLEKKNAVQRVAQLEAQITQDTTRQATADAELKAAKEAVAQKEKELTESKKGQEEIEAERKKQIAEAQTQVTQLSGEKSQAESEKAQADTDVQGKEVAFDNLSAQEKTVAAEIQAARAAVSDAETKLKAVEAQLTSLRQQEKELTEKQTGLQGSITELQTQLQQAEGNLSTKTQARDVLKAQLETLQKEEAELNQQVTQVKTQIAGIEGDKSSEKDLEAARQALVQLQAQQSRLEQAVAASKQAGAHEQAALAKAEERLAEAQKNLSQKESELSAKREELKKLREELKAEGAQEDGDGTDPDEPGRRPGAGRGDKEAKEKEARGDRKEDRKELKEKQKRIRELTIEVKKLEVELAAGKALLGGAEKHVAELREHVETHTAATQKAEENLAQVKAQVSQAEQKVAALSTMSPEKKKELEQLLALKAKLEAKIADNQKAQSEKSQALAMADEAVTKITARVASLKNQIEQAVKAKDTLPAERAKVQAEIAQAENTKNALEAALNKAGESLKLAQAKEQDLQKQTAAARRALADAKAAQGMAVAKIADLDTRLAGLKDRIAKLEAALGMAPESDKIEKQLAELKQGVLEKEKALQAVEQALAKAQGDKVAAEKALAAAEGKIPQAQKEVAELESSLGEKQKESAALEAKKAELEKLLAANLESQKTKSTEIAGLEQEITALDQALAKLQTDIKAALDAQAKIPAELAQVQQKMGQARMEKAAAQKDKDASDRRLVDLKLQKTELLVKLTPLTTSQQLAEARSSDLGKQIAKLNSDILTFGSQLVEAQKLLDTELAEQTKLADRLAQIPSEMAEHRKEMKGLEGRLAIVDQELHSLEELDKSAHERHRQAEGLLRQAEAALATTQAALRQPLADLKAAEAEALRLKNSIASLGQQLNDNLQAQQARLKDDQTLGAQIQTLVTRELAPLEQAQNAARANLEKQIQAVAKVVGIQNQWRKTLESRQQDLLVAESQYQTELTSLNALDAQLSGLLGQSDTASRQKNGLEADNRRLAGEIRNADARIVQDQNAIAGLDQHIVQVKAAVDTKTREITLAQMAEDTALSVFNDQDAVAKIEEGKTAARLTAYQGEQRKYSDALAVVQKQARDDAADSGKIEANKQSQAAAYPKGKADGETQGTALGRSQGQARDEAQGRREGKERAIKEGLLVLKSLGLDKPYKEGMALGQKLGDTEGEPLGYTAGYTQEYNQSNRKAGEAAGYQEGWNRAKTDAQVDYRQAKVDTQKAIESQFKPKQTLEVDNQAEEAATPPAAPKTSWNFIQRLNRVALGALNWIEPTADANSVVVPRFDIPVVASDKAYRYDYQHVDLNREYAASYDAEYVRAFKSQYDVNFRAQYTKGYEEVFEAFRAEAEKIFYPAAKQAGDAKGAVEGKAEIDAHLFGYKQGFARGKARGEIEGKKKAYTEGYQSPTAGEPFGYSENIQKERAKAKQAGVDEVTAFYQSHPVPNAMELSLVDASGNGKFDFEEDVSVSVKLRNFGGVEASDESLSVVVTSVSGLTLKERGEVKLKALPAESEVKFTKVLSGRVNSKKEITLGLNVLLDGRPFGTLSLTQKVESQIKVVLTHIGKDYDKPLWVKRFGGNEWSKNRLWVMNRTDEVLLNPIRIVIVPKNPPGNDNVVVHQSKWETALQIPRVERTLDPAKPVWAYVDFLLFVKKQADLSAQEYTVEIRQQWDNWGHEVNRVLFKEDIQVPIVVNPAAPGP